ncbi:MAG: AAA family ATPase [Planctomycetota bacterium]
MIRLSVNQQTVNDLFDTISQAHGRFAMGRPTHWITEVNDDGELLVSSQGFPWLYCWAYNGLTSTNARDLSRIAFNTIFEHFWIGDENYSLSYNQFDTNENHDWALIAREDNPNVVEIQLIDRINDFIVPDGGEEEEEDEEDEDDIMKPIMDQVLELLLQFRQVILYGPPGTGKTRLAQRIAYDLLSAPPPTPPVVDPSVDDVYRLLDDQDACGRYKLVVFHPAYEYEQFVGGIVPKPGPQEANGNNVGFSVEPGIFMKLCEVAQGLLEQGQKVVLIIDEINRGMLPKLLGELVYALEYRGRKVQLPFTTSAGQSELIIPKNLYIIATMNSSDRSIGHIDVAIRRRFGLYLVKPSVEVVKDVWRKLGSPGIGVALAGVMDTLNKAFGDPEHGVGHSYFIPTAEGNMYIEQVRLKGKHQVEQLLEEYADFVNLDRAIITTFPSKLENALQANPQEADL